MSNPTPPVPRAVPNGWIVLIGGGEFSFGETREVDEFLLSKLDSENRTLVFLPTASGSNEYAIHLARYFKGIAADVEVVNVPIYRRRDARRGKNLDLIRSAGLIYVGGGVAATLLEVLRDSPANEVIRDALAGGTCLAAIGAGAAALGRITRDVHRGTTIDGLNLVVDAAIETGFDPSHDAGLRILLASPHVRFGIGLPAGTALAIGPDGATRILGSGSVAMVRRAAVPVQ